LIIYLAHPIKKCCGGNRPQFLQSYGFFFKSTQQNDTGGI
jgi:hypothetical protein